MEFYQLRSQENRKKPNFMKKRMVTLKMLFTSYTTAVPVSLAAFKTGHVWCEKASVWLNKAETEWRSSLPERSKPVNGGKFIICLPTIIKRPQRPIESSDYGDPTWASTQIHSHACRKSHSPVMAGFLSHTFLSYLSLWDMLYMWKRSEKLHKDERRF